jgi:hypothetical protein
LAKNTTDIVAEIEKDSDINIDKIKKTFRNKIDDKTFLDKFDLIKGANPKFIHNPGDRYKLDKRADQISWAKRVYKQNIRVKPKENLTIALESTRTRAADP